MENLNSPEIGGVRIGQHTKVRSIMNDFRNEYHCEVKVFDGSLISYEDKTVASLAKINKLDYLYIDMIPKEKGRWKQVCNITVKQFKALMSDNFGIKVELLEKDGEKNLSDDECLKPEHPYSAELAEAVKPENEIEVTRSKPRRFQWMFKLGN